MNAVTLSPKNADGTVNGGSSVSATCSASLSTMLGESLTSGSATVSGGTFSDGSSSVPLTTNAATVLAVTTSASGTLTVTCTYTAATSVASSTKSSTATAGILPPPVSAPVISTFTPPPADALVGSTTPVSVSLTVDDPAATYAWTATGGTFANAAAAATEWTAPASQGSSTLTVTITNAGGTVTRSAVVNTAISLYQSSLTAPMSYPRRVAAGADGDLFVVDDRGVLHFLTKSGTRKSTTDALGATAVAVAPDGVYVATNRQVILKFDGATGRKLGSFPWRASSAISGLAWDPNQKLLWAANFEARRAIAFRPDGSIAFSVTQAEGRPLLAVGDVAVDATTNTLWVAEKDGSTGNRLHAFNAADGSYLRSMVGSGSGAGLVIDTGGIALDGKGRIFVSDSWNATVQVMKTDGTFVGTIGSKGDVDGYLLQPRGVAFMANGDLVVANSWFNRLERFGSGAAVPACAGDSDCDGLPDEWEDRYGLNKNDPSDAFGDPDGDGLNNLEELRAGTNPLKADTDGDGYSDRDELLAGFDPLNAGDHRPQLTVGGPIDAPPGLVRISAVGSGPGTCVAAWRQLSGATVALRDASTFTPSFVARKAGTYKFEGIARCGTASSAPAVAQVNLLNVAPIADAGRDVVTSPGRTVTLSAAFSSDANGDALTYAWEQVAGPSTALVARGPSLTVRPGATGYYAFQVTATDGAGLAGVDTLNVAVTNDDLPTAIVAQPFLSATVGVPVTLDASPSVPQGVTFSWLQVDGAANLPLVATPSFTPTAPGLYVFEVTAWSGALRSPPARVVVLASNAALPVAAASAPATGAINAALTLDGAASTGSGTLAYQWRQIAGPAAGLSAADSATPSVVPFATGAYAFELTVSDGEGAVSAPAVVRFDAVAPGKVLPVASATAPSDAQVGQLVVLDGRASTGGTRYRWEQVGGPWVALDGASAVAVFRAPVAGTYRFELLVDDGTVRSAPAIITVNVQ